MFEDDEDNLNFLLSASKEVLLDWYNSVDEDDLLYAKELLDKYNYELSIKTINNEYKDYILPNQSFEYLH